MSLIQLIVNADVYAPQHLGLSSVLIAAGKIVEIRTSPELFRLFSEPRRRRGPHALTAPHLVSQPRCHAEYWR